MQVLKATNDAEEAAIVVRAGECGAVTISTQMSGRGTVGRDRERSCTRAGSP